MLRELYIKNIVLIKELHLDFSKGFSVFTGATGAGKSIMLDSISLALGSRADYSLIRHNEEQAEVVAVFSITSPTLINILKENSIPAQIGEDLIIRRVISSDLKSKSFLNNIPVAVGFLKQISEYLLDIHGQMDNYQMFNVINHKKMLDKFLPDKSMVLQVKNLYADFKNSLNNLQKAQNEIESLLKEQEYLTHIYEEIKEVAPQNGEEEELVAKKQIMQNAKKIYAVINEIEGILSKSDLMPSLNLTIKNATQLANLLPQNENAQEINKTLEQGYVNLQTARDMLESITKQIDFNPEDFNYIEDRIIILRSLAKKHKISTAELPDFFIKLKDKITALANFSVNKKSLEEVLEQKYKIFYEKAKELSLMRKKTALMLEEKINKELLVLHLKEARFLVDIKDIPQNESAISNEKFIGNEGGVDDIVFKVKTNVNTPFGELQKVASGGEMSRIILALKMTFSEVEEIDTLILDEIDIGVGGEVAQSIGLRLRDLAKIKQIMVITHSHQVASCGEHHYNVIKATQNNATTTTVIKLSLNERINEIARMLSGSNITQQALATASDMLKQNTSI